MSLRATDLVGAWELEAFTIRFADGRPTAHPFGPDAQGSLLYTADGHMSAVLSRGDRAPLGVAGLEHAGRASTPAKAGAFDSYLSYTGRWSLHHHTVTHHVTAALVPEAVGQDNVRQATLQDGRLSLSYERQGRSGVVRTHRLVWRRAPEHHP